jgi:hypothetical protein
MNISKEQLLSSFFTNNFCIEEGKTFQEQQVSGRIVICAPLLLVIFFQGLVVFRIAGWIAAAGAGGWSAAGPGRRSSRSAQPSIFFGQGRDNFVRKYEI